MNNRINELTSLLNDLHKDTILKRDAIKEKLQVEYNKVFQNDKSLEKALTNLDNASEYGQDDGGIYRWYRWNGLDDIAPEAYEYFEEYLKEFSDCSATVDWANSCLQAHEGECITIQDDTRRDNGVWLDTKLIIDESEYKDDDGHVDTAKRNVLIEAYMERTGCFPGVFRVTQYGDIFPVNTKSD